MRCYNERDWEVYLTNGDEESKNLKYFQGAIEKDILMEKLKEWHVELSEDELWKDTLKRGWG